MSKRSRFFVVLILFITFSLFSFFGSNKVANVLIINGYGQRASVSIVVSGMIRDTVLETFSVEKGEMLLLEVKNGESVRYKKEDGNAWKYLPKKLFANKKAVAIKIKSAQEKKGFLEKTKLWSEAKEDVDFVVSNFNKEALRELFELVKNIKDFEKRAYEHRLVGKYDIKTLEFLKKDIETFNKKYAKSIGVAKLDFQKIEKEFKKREQVEKIGSLQRVNLKRFKENIFKVKNFFPVEEAYVQSGYCFPMKQRKTDLGIPGENEEGIGIFSNKEKGLGEVEARRFKLHLQIKPEYLISFVQDFLKFIQEDERCKNVKLIKILNEINEKEYIEKYQKGGKEEGLALPMIVIYLPLMHTKDRYKVIGPIVQAIWERYKDVSKDIHLNIMPRYNRQVKDFIYLAGGHGGRKFDKDDYTQDMAFFKGYDIDVKCLMSPECIRKKTEELYKKEKEELYKKEKEKEKEYIDIIEKYEKITPKLETQKEKISEEAYKKALEKAKNIKF